MKPIFIKHIFVYKLNLGGEYFMDIQKFTLNETAYIG